MPLTQDRMKTVIQCAREFEKLLATARGTADAIERFHYETTLKLMKDHPEISDVFREFDRATSNMLNEIKTLHPAQIVTDNITREETHFNINFKRNQNNAKHQQRRRTNFADTRRPDYQPEVPTQHQSLGMENQEQENPTAEPKLPELPPVPRKPQFNLESDFRHDPHIIREVEIYNEALKSWYSRAILAAGSIDRLTIKPEFIDLNIPQDGEDVI